MPINSDKPHLWKPDIAQSVDLYNDWFLRVPPDPTANKELSASKRSSILLKNHAWHRSI
jgi:hypothetical protein